MRLWLIVGDQILDLDSDPVQSALVADDQVKEFEAFSEREKERLFQALGLVTRNRFERRSSGRTPSCPCTSAGIASRRWMSQPAYLFRTAMNAFRSWHRRSSTPLTLGGACGTDHMVSWVSEGPEIVAPGVTDVPGSHSVEFPPISGRSMGGGRWTLTELWEGGNRCA